MSVKSPSTYGDYYWRQQIDAAKYFADDSEAILAAYVGKIWRQVKDVEGFPSEISDLLGDISGLRSFALSPVAGRFLSEVADGTVTSVLKPVMRSAEYGMNKKMPSKRISPEAACILGQRQKIAEEDFYNCLLVHGYSKWEGKTFYDTSFPYPSISDLVTYARYHGDPDTIASEIWKWFDVPAVDLQLWEWLGLQRLSILQAQQLFRRGLYTEDSFDKEIAQIGWSPRDRAFIKELAWDVPPAMLLIQGDLQQGQPKEKILSDISVAGVAPLYAQTYLDALLTKPSSTDVVAFMLREDPTLAGLDAELQKIGIHSDWLPVYKRLAYPIPPVADIITMAVREAFSPAIAERFGQYEDFPPEFQYWAERKGISEDWAKRYWASHWALPSAMQGFEMLHRGVVNQGELNMLLRALDIMPFWREKLTRIAYKRLTRVDIRRMYKAGVLNVEEVYAANLEHGYNERDAKRMTDFTVQWALPKHASITRSDILTAYKNRMISRDEASQLLADMGEEYFHRDFMLKAVDYKRGLELTETKIAAIKNLYKRQVYDNNKTSDELLKLDLPAEEVELIMEQWYFEKRAEPTRTFTTAQTLGFYKKGLITLDRALTELSEIGYDKEHIDIFMKSIE